MEQKDMADLLSGKTRYDPTKPCSICKVNLATECPQLCEICSALRF